MAIRVRKLARQLRKPPVELLGILKTLGFERYKSPEDMLSGTVEQKLRAAVKNGVRPTAVVPERVRKKPAEAPKVEMDALFPGVVRAHDERFDTAPRSATAVAPTPTRAPAKPTPVPTPVPGPTPAVRTPSTPPPEARVEPNAEVAALQAALAAERAVVEAQTRALEAERAALAAERAAFELQKNTPVDAVALAEVFEKRGLVGVDEAERAIRALAASRRTGELLPFLAVSDPDGLLRWLHHVLLLVDGPPPEALENEAMVSVASERAEIPGAAAWRRLASGLSEKLLLNGARRVTVVGGPVRAHRLLGQGLDPRIDVRFRPGSRVVRSDAEADVTRTDAVALWGVEEDPDAREVYGTGRAMVVRSDASDVRTFVEDWVRALSR